MENLQTELEKIVQISPVISVLVVQTLLLLQVGFLKMIRQFWLFLTYLLALVIRQKHHQPVQETQSKVLKQKPLRP